MVMVFVLLFTLAVTANQYGYTWVQEQYMINQVKSAYVKVGLTMPN
jgi:hypothetical protein